MNIEALDVILEKEKPETYWAIYDICVKLSIERGLTRQDLNQLLNRGREYWLKK